MLFALKDLLADTVIRDELAMKETAQTLCDLRKTMDKKNASLSSSAARCLIQSPPPTSGSKYQSKFDRMKALAEKRKELSEGADFTNATATTNTLPSQVLPLLSIDTDDDIICVCDFIDLTRSD